MTTANVALLGAIISVSVGSLIALQSFWIKGAIDSLREDLRDFKRENHSDMQAHTTAIADLRDRVTKLEAKDA